MAKKKSRNKSKQSNQKQEKTQQNKQKNEKIESKSDKNGKSGTKAFTILFLVTILGLVLLFGVVGSIFFIKDTLLNDNDNGNDGDKVEEYSLANDKEQQIDTEKPREEDALEIEKMENQNEDSLDTIAEATESDKNSNEKEEETGAISAESSTPETSETTQNRTHVVSRGDTLWDLAQNYYGSGFEWVKILEENKAMIGFLPNGEQALIFPGQVLVIP
ncbi:MAG: hypothetical protein KatS3mg085_706 [Candidatus Dojkabacteria bacterium]|nr:MAG: hypothetical protein KatS3mg085_706 [Candidatus Dojkabacteria bacterium]